jgi:hypothetical protein
MAKVTYDSTRGLVVESGTGFQVNDAPILEEIEAVTCAGAAGTAAAFGITNVTTDGSAGTNTVTVSNGTSEGQMKTVILAVKGNGGDDVQVASAGGNKGAGVLDTVGDFVHMIWVGTDWAVVGEENAGT